MTAMLAAYLAGMAAVEGDVRPTTASIAARLLTEQAQAGDVCGIGVGDAKFFLLLAAATKPGETAVAAGISADPAALRRCLADHAPDAVVEWPEQSHALGCRFRFVSIDGEHTAQAVEAALHLAERIPLPGGMAALSDVLTADRTGVLTGLAAAMAGGGTLVPFALAPGTLFLAADAETAAHGRAVLRAAFPLALAKTGLEFLGGTIDSYAGPQSGLDDIRRERDTLRAQLAKAVGSVGPLLAQLDEARHDAAALQLQLNDAVRTGEALSAGLRDRIAVEEAMRASTMWRITAPLRSLVDGARRGRRRRES